MTFALIATLLATLASAQQPNITNAQLQPTPINNNLESAIKTAIAKQSTPAWIGYAVTKIPGEHNSCCFNNGSVGCGLEGERSIAGAPTGPVKLEGPTHVAILFRADQGVIGKLRVLSIDCPIDAGGLPFHWLTGVTNAASVATLIKYATDESDRRINDNAVNAIALHSGAEAEAALERFTTSPSVEIRKKAVFWLANSRGKRGYQIVSRIVREDTNDKVREHAIFALTQSSDPDAIPTIIRVAKEDKVPRVRGQALFWLAQKASKQAIGPINEAIDRDPDTEVKKKALFALTQLQSGDGIPMLIQVARTNSNPAVKKQALFWLGQSKDPRALKYFEEVLAR